jgi:hypothetical protein
MRLRCGGGRGLGEAGCWKKHNGFETGQYLASEAVLHTAAYGSFELFCNEVPVEFCLKNPWVLGGWELDSVGVIGIDFTVIITVTKLF